LTYGFKLMSYFKKTTETEAFMRAFAKFTSLNSLKYLYKFKAVYIDDFKIGI